MSTGIVLLIIGAVLAFAVRSDGSWMNIHAVGAILMLGGLAFIARGLVRRREVVVQEDHVDGDGRVQREREVVVEHRPE
ncbi:DUF6458 family protein [Nocardioides montaniterrae]